jgi:NADP-dependent 3-hydroxy acid dehydrogenase YdfG
MKRRQLKGAVVVLTGASSGIGRAAALHFAARGAKLVLAARDATALEEVARECRDTYGVEAIAAPTDVRDELSVDALGGLAIEQFGKVDVWVNDAAVYMMGALEACPSHAIRELFETNIMGVLHGVRAALACFRVCEGSGVIINIGSVAGKISYADAGPYCASKHAVHAITEALRQELVGSDIHACLVVPATVDTPLFQHAANYTGREVLAMRPIYDAKRVAAAIVRCAERPRREVRIGTAPALMTLMARLVPWVYERVQPRMVESDHLGKHGAAPTSGNFADPREPHRVDGGWRARRSPAKKVMNGVRTGALPILTSGG